MAVRHHHDLKVWQLADALRRRWAEILARDRVKRDFDFRDQTRRSIRSACRNTAEGFWKFSHPEFARYLNIVQGSLGELIDSADEARENGFVDDSEHAALTHDTEGVLRAARSLQQYLLKTLTPKH